MNYPTRYLYLLDMTSLRSIYNKIRVTWMILVDTYVSCFNYAYLSAGLNYFEDPLLKSASPADTCYTFYFFVYNKY